MSLELEILQYNYSEHFKYYKELSLILPLEHPKRVRILKEINAILDKIHRIQKEKK